MIWIGILGVGVFLVLVSLFSLKATKDDSMPLSADMAQAIDNIEALAERLGLRPIPRPSAVPSVAEWLGTINGIIRSKLEEMRLDARTDELKSFHEATIAYTTAVEHLRTLAAAATRFQQASEMRGRARPARSAPSPGEEGRSGDSEAEELASDDDDRT